ncbi:signal peptidase I [Planctomicrobium piriforme]|nr:signal peptidase I [Planctomicrobium piriforme]
MPQTEPTPAPVTTEAPKPAAKAKPKHKHKEGTRDTVESILFAFVLAFLFRTFEAEAFVIPTGSMAPTLYGRHKESHCTACGYHIVVGASHEVIPETGYLATNSRLRAAICPNCGFENDQLYNDLAFNGDRILVNKFPYEFGEPDRWDVFVFKYPAEPQTNYIKRLVGLPGETIRIRNGNLFSVDGQTETILRKEPTKQRSLQIPVYDDRDPPTDLIKAGWPERWAGMTAGDKGQLAQWSDATTGWKQDPAARSFSITKDQSAEPAWLRYRHYFPMPQDWRSASHGLPLAPQARLIGDFCGYNATIGDHPYDASSADGVDYGPYWVPDLTINFDLNITEIADNAEITLELCEGTSWYRFRVNPKSGEAVLEEVNSQLNGRVKELAKAQTDLKGTGSYRISYANVDDRLLVWIDDALVDFGEGNLLDTTGATANPFPTQQDLTPVGIAARGVTATVSELLLERDIYYRVGHPGKDHRHRSNELARFVTDPEMWSEVFARYESEMGERTLVIPEGHFLAFGDNSPQSNDSRMWDLGQETVPRKFLVGKAFWIYWPHGVPFLNGGRGFPVTYNSQHPPRGGDLETLKDYPRYTVPFYPQFSRMNRIR